MGRGRYIAGLFPSHGAGGTREGHGGCLGGEIDRGLVDGWTIFLRGVASGGIEVVRRRLWRGVVHGCLWMGVC